MKKLAILIIFSLMLGKASSPGSKNLQIESDPSDCKTLHHGCPVHHQDAEATDPSDAPQ
jgi:hypothetical protein